MGEAIGQALPLGVGIAVSPLPIVAVVLMLTTARARSNGPAFVLGWLAGLGVVGAVVLVVAGPSASDDQGQPAGWVSWLKLVLGVLLLIVAVKQFRNRPGEGEQGSMPAWMSTIDQFTAGKALGVGVVLAAANPKNLLLAVGGASAVAQTGIPGGQQALAYAIFAVIGTIGVAAPVVVYFTMGDKAADRLSSLKGWMVRHNAVIMGVLCLVIGVKLVGDALGGLTT